MEDKGIKGQRSKGNGIVVFRDEDKGINQPTGKDSRIKRFWEDSTYKVSTLTQPQQRPVRGND
jgi:hypothetical protein